MVTAVNPRAILAHHWEISADGLRWHFYIRSTLHWHNGDKIGAGTAPAKPDGAVIAAGLGTLFHGDRHVSETASAVRERLFSINLTTGWRTGWQPTVAVWRIPITPWWAAVPFD